jgi:hypothetical protein
MPQFDPALPIVTLEYSDEWIAFQLQRRAGCVNQREKGASPD